MNTHVSRPALTWACHLAMFVFGIDIAILGASLPALFRQMSLNPAEAGGLFIFLNGGGLLVALASGPAFDKFGYRVLLTLAAALSSASLLGIAFADDYATLALCSFLLGLGGGGLNSGSNAFIADLYPERQAAALNRLGVFFGFGALFIPLFIGSLLNFLPLRTILMLAAGIAFLPGFLYLTLRFPPGKLALKGFPLRAAGRVLSNPLVLLMGLALFFQSGNEMTLNVWLAPHLVDNLDVSPAQAPFYLAAFWGCLMLARTLSPRLLARWNEATLVQVSALASIAAVLLFAFYPHVVLSGIFAGLIGFALAAIFPCILGLAAARFPELSATVFGILMSIALLGGMFVPWISGQIVQAKGTRAGLLVAVFGFAMVFILQTIMRRRTAP